MSDDHLGRTTKHLFHFIQVTDIHLTHFGNADRTEQFEQFCNETLRTLIKPPVTVVSGDLVNSANDLLYKRGRMFQSAQYEEEWKIYRHILNRTNITKYTQWLDMRGNHDTFMDSDPDSKQSFYRIYSHQGQEHTGSYQYTIETQHGDTYSFISIDMCPRPGIGRPFNILGYITKKEMKSLAKLSEEIKNSTARIFFGHYPLAFSYSKGLDKIMLNGLVYLNGHLHSVTKHFFTRHKDQLLEIELGDWKSHRRFRLLTIDSGLLSFEDYQFDQFIYGVITNPKAAKFKTYREPLYRLKQSSHIRILIFAKRSIINVDVYIDGTLVGEAIPSIDNANLFILFWNASLYHNENLHEILVNIRDNANNTLKLEHQFSLSASTINSFNRSNLILSIHWPTFFLVTLIISLCGFILVLIFSRFQTKQKFSKLFIRHIRFDWFRCQLILLCSVDLVYYSLVGLAFYHFVGPWYIGYLTEHQFGAVFLWGTVVGGVYLPPDAQLFMGNVQLYFFIFPLTYVLGSSCFYRYIAIESNHKSIKSRFNRCCRICNVYVLFVYTMLFVFLWSFLTTISHRFSWILSPFGVLLIIYSLVLYIKCQKLKNEDFQLIGTINSNDLENLQDEEQLAVLNTKSQ